jgi:hypothetical protein
VRTDAPVTLKEECRVSQLTILLFASAVAMIASTVGAVALGKGPSVLWSVVMFGGMVASWLTIGTIVAGLYASTGELHWILALVPVAMTVASLRAYNQSKAPSKPVE